MVLLPYDSREQVTSGVLIEAVDSRQARRVDRLPARRRAALERGGAARRPRRTRRAIAAALRRLFTEPGLEAAMSAEAERIAPELLWPAVADRYRAVAAAVVPARSVLATA